MAENLTPQDIQKAMLTELMRMRKAIAEADALRPKVKRAEKFIRELSDIWNLPMPQDLVPKSPVAVPQHPRPEGITVVEEMTCPEPQCGRSFEKLHGLRMHQMRAACDISGPGHGKLCTNHRGLY